MIVLGSAVAAAADVVLCVCVCVVDCRAQTEIARGKLVVVCSGLTNSYIKGHHYKVIQVCTSL